MKKDKEDVQAMNAFVVSSTSLGVDGLRQEFEKLSTCPPKNNTYAKSTASAARNRYKDVLCPDATRVVLTLNVPPESDYINANWIKFDGVDKPFIATQGPTETTAGDFWRMVYQEGQDAAPTIIMLCQVVEERVQKCFQYWPLQQGSFKTYGTVMVTNKSTEPVDRFMSYTLEVLPDGCSNSVVTTLYQTNDWPDRGVPQSPMSILRLLRHVRNNKLAPGPCIVHCSAGIGRTGTIIAIEAALQMLFKGKTPSIKEVVKKMRDQRPGMVKTPGQYVFIYACLFYYIHAKTKEHKDLVVRFHESFVASNLL